MDTFSQNELKRMKKLEDLQRVFRSILKAHSSLLLLFGLASLIGFFALFYLLNRNSSSRFEASVGLHYQPKQTANVQAYSDKYVMHILNRQTVRRHFTEGLFTEKNGVVGKGPTNIQVEQGVRQNNYFVVSLEASTEEDAVAYVNMFAELCTLAYAEERMASLENWKATLERQKQDVNAEIAQLSDKLNQLNVSAVMVSPEKNYEFLQNRLTEAQSALAKVETSLRVMEQQRHTLEESQSDIFPKLLPNIKRSNEYVEELGRLDQELQLLREKYTSQNPKLLAVEKRRQEKEKEFHEFLKSKGLDMSDLDFLESAPALVKELNRVNGELITLQETYNVQAKLVEKLEKDLRDFNVTFPKRQGIVQQQEKLAVALGNLDATINDINYLLPMVKEDLFIGEMARSAVQKLPFTKETVTLSVLGTIALTGLLAVLLLILGYFFGEVSSEEELDGIEDFHYLGIMPTDKSKFSAGTSERLFYSGISHQFNAIEKSPQVVLLGCLPGGELRHSFVQAFAEDCAVDERRVLVLEMVPAHDFKISPDVNFHRGNIAIYSDQAGYLPVDNFRFLMPREETKLRSDMQVLRKHFDLICIVQFAPLTQDGVFFEQCTTLCDGAVLAVGVKKTPRRLVRQLQGMQAKSQRLLVMTILSGRIKSC